MIHSDCLKRFQSEAEKYSGLKEKVKKYIESRYIEGTKDPVSVYSIRVGFQMVVGDVSQGALSLWLQEWGYKVKPGHTGSPDNISHLCFLRQKPLILEEEESREHRKKKKGVVVY